MASSPVKADDAQTEVSAKLDQAAYHKRQVRRHRKAAQECMAEASRLRAQAERLGFQIVIVPASSQPGGTEHEHHPDS